MTDEIELPDISPPGIKERLENAGEFGIALTGGPAGVAAYYFARATRLRVDGIEEAVHEIARRLNELEGRAKRGDEVIDGQIEEILEKVLSKRERDKRAYWGAAAAHTAVDDFNAVERARMIDTLELLRPSHLWLLHRVAVEDPDGWTNGNMDSFLTYGVPGADIRVIRLDWNDLMNAGILANYPSGLTTTSHHILARQAIPDFGRRFIAFIEA